jgi:hypothetical protein
MRDQRLSCQGGQKPNACLDECEAVVIDVNANYAGVNMPNGYLQIPDWFSFENQGGGIAVANLTGGANQDFLVTAIDNPDGKNRGLYRVGPT